MSQLLGDTFGSYGAFQAAFEEGAADVFGSGWACLVAGGAGNMRVSSTPNQDSPAMEGSFPILGLDVWEHAYYLSYRNRRTEYTENFWEVVNWDAVERSYLEASAVGTGS